MSQKSVSVVFPESVDNNRNWAGTYTLCNKQFHKLNVHRAKNHLLKITDVGIHMSKTFSHDQHRLLPGGYGVTTQKHVYTFVLPMLTREADNKMFVVYRYVSIHRTPIHHNSRHTRRFSGDGTLLVDYIVQLYTGIHDKPDTFRTPDLSGVSRHTCRFLAMILVALQITIRPGFEL